MSKTILNFWLDTCILLTFVVFGIVSTILQFVFPPGPATSGWSLWGWDYIAWRDLQFILLCVFTAEIVLHVMLHWSWVCGIVTTRLLGKKAPTDDGIRTIYGVATLIILLHIVGVSVAIAYLTVHGPNQVSSLLRTAASPC